MANTFDSALVSSIAASTAITVLQHKLAPFRAFSTDFSKDIVEKGGTVNVPVYTTGSAAVKNPTNFEDASDSTLTNAPVVLNPFSAKGHLTSKQLNSGSRLETLLTGKLHALGDGVMGELMALILTANFGSAVVTDTDDFFKDGGGSQLLYAALAKGTRKALVLDPSISAQALPANKDAFSLSDTGAFGWQGIHENTLWTGATSGVKGFAASPEAIAVGAAIPEIAEAVAQNMLSSETIDIPGLGLSVQFNVWGSTSTRNLHFSFDVAFGCAKADGSALKLIIPA